MYINNANTSLAALLLTAMDMAAASQQDRHGAWMAFKTSFEKAAPDVQVSACRIFRASLRQDWARNACDAFHKDPGRYPEVMSALADILEGLGLSRARIPQRTVSRELAQLVCSLEGIRTSAAFHERMLAIQAYFKANPMSRKDGSAYLMQVIMGMAISHNFAARLDAGSVEPLTGREILLVLLDGADNPDQALDWLVCDKDGTFRLAVPETPPLAAPEDGPAALIDALLDAPDGGALNRAYAAFETYARSISAGEREKLEDLVWEGIQSRDTLRQNRQCAFLQYHLDFAGGEERLLRLAALNGELMTFDGYFLSLLGPEDLPVLRSELETLAGIMTAKPFCELLAGLLAAKGAEPCILHEVENFFHEMMTAKSA